MASNDPLFDDLEPLTDDFDPLVEDLESFADDLEPLAEEFDPRATVTVDASDDDPLGLGNVAVEDNASDADPLAAGTVAAAPATQSAPPSAVADAPPEANDDEDEYEEADGALGRLRRFSLRKLLQG
ncbi:MAG: hypothetical protein ABI614_19560, partial [Planctomycetota bacterium]